MFMDRLKNITIRQALIWIFKGVLGLFILIHVYALLLRLVPVPGTMLMMQRSLSGENISKDWTRLEDISPYLAYAVIGAEDSRFCQHHGIDFKAIEKVLEEREKTGRKRGGSTISQQTAKNVFLWNGGGWIRKLPETWMTLVIDTLWGKRRVMEVYLNVAEWGDGIFGAEAAAQARFGKSAKNLSVREAALLAAVLPSPNKWRLDPPGDYVSKRARSLEARAADVHWGKYGACALPKDVSVTFPVRPKPPVTKEPEAEPEAEVETKPKPKKKRRKKPQDAPKDEPAEGSDSPEETNTPKDEGPEDVDVSTQTPIDTTEADKLDNEAPAPSEEFDALLDKIEKEIQSPPDSDHAPDETAIDEQVPNRL